MNRTAVHRPLAAVAVAATLVLTFGGVAQAATVAKATGKVGKDPGPASQSQCEALAASIDLLNGQAAAAKDPAAGKRYLTSAATARSMGEWHGCVFTTSGSGTIARTKGTATGKNSANMRAATQAECDAFATVLDDLQEGINDISEPSASAMIQQAWDVVFYGGRAMGCSFSTA